jgi:hypothetical protein
MSLRNNKAYINERSNNQRTELKHKSMNAVYRQFFPKLFGYRALEFPAVDTVASLINSVSDRDSACNRQTDRQTGN